MKTDVKLDEGQITCTFQITDNYSVTTHMTPNDARNFKAQLEAALKALSRGDKD